MEYVKMVVLEYASLKWSHNSDAAREHENLGLKSSVKLFIESLGLIDWFKADAVSSMLYPVIWLSLFAAGTA